MKKLSYVNKHFQVDVKKRFVNFQGRTIDLCKTFAVQIFKYDMKCKKQVFFVSFAQQWKLFRTVT